MGWKDVLRGSTEIIQQEVCGVLGNSTNGREIWLRYFVKNDLLMTKLVVHPEEENSISGSCEATIMFLDNDVDLDVFKKQFRDTPSYAKKQVL